MNIATLEITPNEFKHCIEELDRLLTDSIKTPGLLLSLDRDKLTGIVDSYIDLNTESYWGFFKLIKKRPVTYRMSRNEAIKLRAALEYRLEKSVKTSLNVSEQWFSRVPMFYR